MLQYTEYGEKARCGEEIRGNSNKNALLASYLRCICGCVVLYCLALFVSPGGRTLGFSLLRTIASLWRRPAAIGAPSPPPKSPITRCSTACPAQSRTPPPQNTVAQASPSREETSLERDAFPAGSGRPVLGGLRQLALVPSCRRRVPQKPCSHERHVVDANSKQAITAK